jgi:predicted lipid-binding transport protein (Tim44 family)
MKRILVTLMVALFSVLLVAPEADARRMGGGRSIGKQSDIMKRDAARPPAQSGQQATQQPPASSAAAGATGRRSWMGPIAGIAAGLGLAALASHLGLGEEFGTILLMALVFLVVLVAVRMFMARRNGSAGAPRPAYAGGGAGHGGSAPRGAGPAAQPWAARSGRPGEGAGNGSAWAPPAGGAAAAGAAAAVPATVTASASGDVPADFDVDRFIHAAKVNFVRLQTAFDNNRADDLREFTSPEMFAELSLDLMQRGKDEQTTDVVTLDARLLGVERADLSELASVRFEGMLREGSEQAAAPFVEVWNFTRPIDRSSGWVLAGIQQVS